MHRGFAKVHRKITEWEWYTDVPVKTLFLHLVITANHKDNKWRGIEIKRGEKLTSIQSLCKETGLKTQQTRTAISKLKSTGEITTKATSKYTIVTLCKYEEYNESEIATNKVTNKQNNDLVTNEQQTSNKQVTTNKNDKNENNGKKKEYSEEFEGFWKYYGMKGNKRTSFEKWVKLTEAQKGEIREKLPAYVKATEREGRKFRKDAQTYLNPSKEYWNDVVVDIAPKSKGQPMRDEYKEPEFDVNDFLVN